MHLNKEIMRLKKMMSTLCALVEESMRHALVSVIKHDKVLAKEVIENDKKIDELEIELEEECLKILALHQPVASDLRYVIACMKMNNDLERIGDLSASIAKRTITISDMDYSEEFEQIYLELMMRRAEEMVRLSLNALFDMDIEQAKAVIYADDEVDALRDKMYKNTLNAILKSPTQTIYFIQLLDVSKNIERIADYATNIAEDTIYMLKGEIVRHDRLHLDKKQGI